MRVNEGRVKTHFLDTRLSLAIQLNNDDGLSVWSMLETRALKALCYLFFLFRSGRSLS